MRITGDYHTHTKYSKNNHGKDDIFTMVKTAEEKGLESYGISDHGPKHLLFGIKRKNISKAKKELDNLKKDTKLNLYFSVEANLCKCNGEIDLDRGEIEQLDHLLVGYHRGVINNFYCMVRNLFNPKKQIEINTEAYINCLERYNVFALTHLNTYIKVDLKKVCTKAKEKGTLIELNNKHINFSKEDAKILLDSGVKFLISSDAHKKEDIARFDKVERFIIENNIPLERIVNIAEAK